jgi:N-acetylglucosaminyldiphosphoundecaprenol N-acetyl-beta-D-mannosaminyltransferase
VTANVSLLGLEFADLAAPEAAEAIAARPAESPFGYVVTPNADHLVRLSEDPDLAGIYRDAWLCLMDSRVVAGMARGAGLKAPHVATGSDVTELLLRRYIHVNEKIAIIGLRPAWLPALVERCGLAAPYHYDPPMGFDRDPAAFAATVRYIVAHPARLIFLAVGSPRQERLAAAVAATGRATGTGLCIGASLAFLVGAERRAPAWIRRCGLEWAYRLAGDPRRMARRYLVDSPRVVMLLARAAVAGLFGVGGVSLRDPDVKARRRR